MRRREFIAGLGGAAAWPVVVRGQQRAVRLSIGYLTPASQGGTTLETAKFLQGLSEAGFIAGSNVEIVYRFLDGQWERMPAAAAELVRHPVSLIFAASPPAVRAVKAVTADVPVVFSIGEDPVKEGLVASMNRPGGNVTGFANFQNLLGSKKLSLLANIVAKPALLGLLVSSTNPNAEPDTQDAQEAATALGRKLQAFTATTADDLPIVFAAMAQLGVGGLLVNIDPLFLAQRAQIIALAAKYAIPALYDRQQFPAAGGLMSYGAGEAEGYRWCGQYVGRILKGTNPADLPVVQPTKLELVINLKAAKALGLTISETLLATADEVIQ
jgi:putative tryptophan/tyrosine transport system substrate-binding protein